jgi:Putative Ig domain
MAAAAAAPLLDAATVRARPEGAEMKLRLATYSCSVGLADLIRCELASPPPNDPVRRQALLAQALGATYSAFQANWDHPAGVATFSLALLFGFSERLLDEILSKLEGKADADVASTPLLVTKLALPPATVGTPYSQQLEATGGAGRITWALGQGASLPASLYLSASGAISGTPLNPGTFSFSVAACDGKATASGAFTLIVHATPAAPAVEQNPDKR